MSTVIKRKIVKTGETTMDVFISEDEENCGTNSNDKYTIIIYE